MPAGPSSSLTSMPPSPASPSGHHPDQTTLNRKLLLALGALGVVYGDIGTSPLYTVKECFHGPHAMAISTGNILGVMSLIFWSLTMVVTVKYVIFILRADNHGEGGIYAMAALFLSKGRERVHPAVVNRLMLLAIFGAALLCGEGLITPVISVLSAIEGLNVATQAAEPFVLPLSCGVLLGLFLVQSKGTERIGKVFGPIMILWFVSLAACGLAQIRRTPIILQSFDPRYAVSFFIDHRLHGVLVLGAVVLCITGCEALYADLGHFGRGPIRFSWLVLVFPALLLNYLGQTALLLEQPQAAVHPFYGLVPRPLLYPMVALATTATIIASQAMISGVFSLMQQAIQIGYAPRLRIVHTSGETKGQIYLPWINSVMLVGCLGLALAFKESSRLAAAYGIAVTGTMCISTIIYFNICRHNWDWPLWQALPLAGLFFFFDFSFFSANLLKFVDGGWFAVSVAVILFTVMVTWRDGRAALRKRFEEAQVPLDVLMYDIATYKLVRTPGTAFFLSVSPTGTPIVLLHLLKHTDALPERVFILSMVATDAPYVPREQKLEVTDKGYGFYRVVASYGFMETPRVPEIIEMLNEQGLDIDIYATSFYLGRESLLTTGPTKMAGWRKGLFAFLSRNAWNVSTFFGIPPGRVVELGSQVEI
ncbi:MAG: potassium transporter Kup [Desulfobacca sp.]|uniref:potassium transporter Kup n=1 Tax=Desulfobacca sp. TaxID=2067990 RepID=UPI00404B824A